MEITEGEVLKELRILNPNKAAGPNNISTRVLKECAKELTAAITSLFNKTIQEGTILSEWKCTNIVPIFEKGSKTAANNYRVISLLPIISKVLERCIFNKIIDKIALKITNLQHGFMKDRSTNTQRQTHNS